MSSFTIEDATTDDKLLALSHWWERHCKSFSTWFLMLTSQQQRDLFLKAVPDMPEESIYESSDVSLKATDVILPEFSLSGMLSNNGRIFILFMTRRLVAKDLCMQSDLKLLNDIHQRKMLPSLSNNALEQMDTPFVDPMDPDENIRSLSNTSSPETREAVVNHITLGRVIRAEVWLALKLRRAAIATLLEVMAEEHFAAVTVKPSPTYKALLHAELNQQHTLEDNMSQEQAEQPTTSNEQTESERSGNP